MDNVERCRTCRALVFEWDLKFHYAWHNQVVSEIVRAAAH